MCTSYLYCDLNKTTVQRYVGGILRKLSMHKVAKDTIELLLVMLSMMMVL